MKYKILVITDDTALFNEIRAKITLKREADKPLHSSFKDAKQILGSKTYDVVIIEDLKEASGIVNAAKNSGAEIIILKNGGGYSRRGGVFDCIEAEIESDELNCRLINCLKYSALKRQLEINRVYLENTGVLNGRSGCFTLKYLKEVFGEIRDINNSVLCVITLDETVKTKVSLNRLAGVLKKSIRANDILTLNNNGLFYVILCNTNFERAKSFIDMVQSKMGADFPVRSGVAATDYKTFDEAEKNACDGLQSALKNGLAIGSMDNNSGLDPWLDTDFSTDKRYKFFINIYEKKLKNVIEPVFYRFKKENEGKFDIIQYANPSESAFCFKDENGNSELIIRHDGFAGIKTEILHEGLESTENTAMSFGFDRFNEKELLKLLKHLKREYIQSRK